ncbi:MAG: pyridoxamine 5'-phosphate oxidase family protein [Chromatiales bacterium]|nr:pyridoxamine 5'-phosphate oxidase family protein [Chromatiales bacterium]
MAQKSPDLSEELKEFIEKQKIFFVATAAIDGRVNISPKGMDSLKVLDRNRVVWLNMTGSGNETAAHIQESTRMTIMFCAFEGAPLIVRLYGSARVLHHKDPDWNEMVAQFDELPGARQIFELTIDLVQSSCGAGVPLFDFIDERDELSNWLIEKGDDGVKTYWRDRNQLSIDGKPTLILEKNGL